MSVDVFAQLQKLAEEARAADIVTLVGAPPEQAEFVGQMVLVADGQSWGEIVNASFTADIVNSLAGMAWKKPAAITRDFAGGTYRLFWDKLSRRQSALVLGAGHISQPLTLLLAMIGYTVTVVDDRPDFANTVRFPQAQAVVCQNFDRALEELNLASFGAIIVVTRGHRSDVECLRAVITQPAAYVGMIGSQGRVRGVINSLLEEGFARESLDRLRAPIGLDIGAQTPEEIALSIAAEIVAVDRGANCRPLSDKWRCK
ncbi:XdhC family protein [Sporomusa aerivorans]|uniref:XdhC family protein n=1 Tax=Sporomusa aerivorans TaxID=204936 RepID=UPI00352B949E